MEEKFKKGDTVRILENRLNPKAVGKNGVIIQVYEDANTKEPLYRVRLTNRKSPLKGLAEEYCLEKVEE
ncbi:MAG: hypothetical protein IJQ84_05010 [Paludibacteraceae bacterium]|nr:hypothetical protein [Paludibacteraceae bacterium]